MTDPTISTVQAVVPRDDDEHWREMALAAGRASVEADVPVRYRDATVTVPEVADWVRALVMLCGQSGRVASISRGPSLLLVGSVGVGKTHQAYAAVRALACSGAYLKWVFTSAADCYAQMRPRPGVDSEREFERYARAGLLVLDDLGVAKSSEWTEEINYRLINHRYEREMPTLVTSNIPPKQLAATVGDRVASRLIEMTTQAVIKGPDRRRHA